MLGTMLRVDVGGAGERNVTKTPQTSVRVLISLAYTQVSGVLAAFSIAVLVGELFGVGWRGAIGQLIGVWDEYVRPVAKQITEAILWPANAWLHLHIAIPLALRDYFSVGAIMTLSVSRAIRHVNREDREGGGWGLLPGAAMWVLLLWGLAYFWPLALLFGLAGSALELFGERTEQGSDYFFTLSVLPVVYVGLLALVSYVAV
jgi:hypothetical protein